MSTTFSSLPFELIIEILKYISWRDMLRVRRVCKLLLTVSRERCFWERYIHEHMLTSKYPPVLDKPTAIHTPSELENTFLLWKSAERGWMWGDGRQVRERNLVLPSTIESIYVVPGGRWLLITTAIAEVYYADLSMDTVCPVRLLIGAQFNMRGKKNIEVSVDLDLASPVLKFNVAFSLQEDYTAAGRPSPRRGRLQIWGVELQGDLLKASLLASIPYLNIVRRIQYISLQGPDVAFSTTTAGYTGNKASLYIIKWSEPDAQPRSLGVIMRNCKLQLLPNNLILTLELFNLTLWSQGTETMIKIWEIDVYGVNIPRTLTVARSQTSCRLPLVIGESVCSLELSDFFTCTSKAPQLRTILDTWPGMTFVNTQHMLGPAHEVIVTDRSISIRARRASQVIALTKYSTSRLHTPTAPPVMDEHSGRIVIPQLKGVVVLDVATIYH